MKIMRKRKEKKAIYAKGFQRLPLIWKMIVSYSALVCLLLLIVLGYLLYHEVTDRNEEIEAQITQMSAALAENPSVIQALQNGALSSETTALLNTLYRNLTYIDYIVIVNTEDIRLYHTESERIGFHFEGGDEGPALAGSAPYVTEGKGSRQYQLRSFNSVFNEQGDVLGFVMVSTYMSRLVDLRLAAFRQFGFLFAAALALGILFASLIARSIRRSLLGYEPDQLRDLYIQKSDVLNSLDEGLIAMDTGGSCIYYNNSAIHMFQTAENIQQFINRELSAEVHAHNGPRRRIEDYETNRRIHFGPNDFLVSLLPIEEEDQPLGLLAILRDRTEVNELAEELTGVQHIIAALRATTHEHKNKLHVIMGLLQIGDTQAAMDYISTSGDNDYQAITYIYDRIENRTIAALLCGKQRRARELDITFSLQGDSHLDSHNDYLSVNDMVTIIGNLIENAFDALKEDEGVREVSLFIQNTDEGITIIVDDTGPGMPEAYIEKIYQGKFTTKGEDHGIGLSLIKNILHQSGGIMDIASVPGEGTSFTISVNQQRLKTERKSEEA